MMKSAMNWATMGLGAAALVGAIACGGMEADDASGGGSNVGFGGAQDIGQFRDLLERGEIPGEATLDANGFFSEHYAELPPPDCGEPLCMHAMLAVSRDWVRWRAQAVVQVALNTTISGDDIADQPLDLVVVVDTSGSMLADARLEKVRDGLHLIVDQLGEDDRLGLVRYSSDVEVLSELAAPNLDMHEVIDSLTAAGSTNISGGLSAGFSLLADEVEEGRQRRVILLSDGLANVGLTQPEQIFELAEAFIRDGVGLTTIGVGTSFNTELMSGLAQRGSGNFYFLEDAAAVNEVFTEELEYFAAPIAFDVEIEMRESASYSLGEVVGTTLTFGSEAQRIVQVPSVFVASRRSDDPGESGRRGGGSALFLELIPKPGASEAGEAMTLTVSYTLPDGRSVTDEVVVTNPHEPGVVPSDDYYSQEFMREHYGMYNMYLGLREATRVAAYDYACASALLQSVQSNARMWNDVVRDEDIESDLGLVTQFLANIQQRMGSEYDSCTDYYPEGEDPYPFEGDDDIHYAACAATSGTGRLGWMAMLVAVAMVGRRRSRRSRQQC